MKNEAEIQTAIDNETDGKEKARLQRQFFHFASDLGKISILDLLLKQGVSIDSKVIGLTALAHAAFNHDLPTVKWLVEMGADVNSEDDSQQTPLLWATHTICLPIEDSRATTMYSMAKYLLENGAKVNAVNTYGLSILHSACQSGVISIVKLLDDYGANFFTRCGDGETPLITASKLGHLKVVQYLIEKKLEVNDKDDYGRTSLYYAIKENYFHVAQCLLANGANPDTKAKKM